MSGNRPVLPPMPQEAASSKPRPPKESKAAKARKAEAEEPRAERAQEQPSRGNEQHPAPRATHRAPESVVAGAPSATSRPATAAVRPAPRTRQAHLRLVRIDAWSVMKTAFLLSIAVGIVMVVAVGIIWGVLGAAGVWDSINSMVQQVLGSDNSSTFDITQYVGTSRVLGFTMIVAVVDVILITALATLAAFIYNLAATLLGGIEVTLAEDR